MALKNKPHVKYKHFLHFTAFLNTINTETVQLTDQRKDLWLTNQLFIPNIGFAQPNSLRLMGEESCCRMCVWDLNSSAYWVGNTVRCGFHDLFPFVPLSQHGQTTLWLNQPVNLDITDMLTGTQADTGWMKKWIRPLILTGTVHFYFEKVQCAIEYYKWTVTEYGTIFMVKCCLLRTWITL